MQIFGKSLPEYLRFQAPILARACAPAFGLPHWRGNCSPPIIGRRVRAKSTRETPQKSGSRRKTRREATRSRQHL